jgi:hypothetical protein
VWLVLDLALAALGLVLILLLGLHAWSRFRRMTRFGRRAGERLSSLAADAGRLADRLDQLAEQADDLGMREPGRAVEEIRTGRDKASAR